jgi:hypothetical protein
MRKKGSGEEKGSSILFAAIQGKNQIAFLFAKKIR